MRRDNVAVALVAVVALAAAATLVPGGSQDRTLASYDVSARIGPPGLNVSVSVDDDSVDFGTVPSNGTRVARTVTVGNGGTSPVTVEPQLTGNITPYVTVTPRRMELPPATERNITVTFAPDPALADGTVFAGTLRVVAR